jgi:AAA domain/UvrD-like helicase C-terminal domain
MNAEIKMNPDQVEVVQLLTDFIADPDSDWYFTFSGYAGVGKTFCMREVVAKFRGSRTKFAFTAPTNKAAKELRKQTGEAGTIYSLLGLRIDKSGEVKQVVGSKDTDLSDVDVIVVDESSMVNGNLFGILQDACEKWSVKVIFMGDPAQLPPVGEPYSPIWRGDVHATLTKVMRHDNQILTLCTAIREQMDHIAPSINLKNDHDEAQGVWKLSKTDFKQRIYDAAIRGDFADGNTAKVVAWRNLKVGEYNNLIRAGIYGAEAVPGYFLPGERIVAAGPCERGDQVLLTTDDEALVESAVACQHPIEPAYKGLELKCRTEDGRVIRLLVLHPDSAQAFNNDSARLAHEAKANGRLWKTFWNHKELFHDIKYGYALTTHRAQGSTFRDVYVDYTDILYNRNRKEAFQCLYTACSRPTTNLFLA